MLEILSQAVAAIPVKSTTGMLTAAGIWTAVIGGTMGLLAWWIRLRPKMKELSDAQKNIDFSNFNARLAEVESRVEQANKRADEADEKAHQSDKKLDYVIIAFQLVASELKRLDPDSPALGQANELLAMASTGDLRMDRAIQKLSTLRSSGESE